MKTPAIVEPLEARIAPAANSFSYFDFDGDKVTVTNSIAAAIMNPGFDASLHQLQTLGLTDASNAGADITFTVKKAPGGDGLVNVGRINAGTNALGKVVVPGDLAVIDAGDGAQSVTSLTVRSMGKFSTFTQATGADLHSDLDGAFGTLKVKGDVEAVTIAVTGPNGHIDAINIGGSLSGNGDDFSGEIHTDQTIGTVKIGRDVRGSEGTDSGYIESFTSIHSVTIGGSVIGGSGSYFAMGNPSAQIWAGGSSIEMVKIGRDLKGGAGDGSGSIGSGGSLAVTLGVTVGGSLIGGPGDAAGSIFCTGDMGAVKIGHDVRGGAGHASGIINPGGKLAGAMLGGSLVGGSGKDSGEVLPVGGLGFLKIGRDMMGGSGDFSGSVYAGNGGGTPTVSIGGSVVGGAANGTGVISIGGNVGAVKIGGSVVGGSLTGDNSGIMRLDTGAIYIGGSLGPVTIGGDLVGGSITSPAADSLVGSGYIEAAHIASITIGGSIIAGTTDNGGFDKDASIRARDDIGPIVVKGSIAGNESGVIIISARGQTAPVVGDVAIKSVTVGGDVNWASILGGWKPDFTADNGNAQIGAVKVGGDWSSSSLTAGMTDPGSDGFGKNDLPIIAGGGISKIASVAIGGVVTGNFNVFYFGFEAHTIGKFKAGGVTLPFLDATPLQTFALSLNSGNVFAIEL